MVQDVEYVPWRTDARLLLPVHQIERTLSWYRALSTAMLRKLWTTSDIYLFLFVLPRSHPDKC
jgi:hypothetical protein